MKWVKIGAALLVIVFVGLYLTAPFVDSLSSTLPHTLSSRLREIGFALYGYSQAHGRFPDRLEDLTGGSFYLNDAVDPYSPDRSLFRYKRVVDATGEHYELFTVRMAAPAQIGWVTADRDLWIHTAAYTALCTNGLEPESENKKLRPGAGPGDWLLFLLQRGR